MGEGAQVAAGAVPSDKINLRLLLVSGKKTDLLMNPTDTIETVCRTIASAWPVENIKILLRGKFLERPSTLASNSIATGDTTVVHLLVKNDAAPQAAAVKDSEKSMGCSCILL
ncbi:hypothetical protein HK105_200306 [Polyrhizophydium stewartii]|uniref:Ubiquitin-like domain-containing protein n=1 Tax=Polyrhizophydium stewartii TaxID=2732419 RepID=A0ABR4NL29_9FUNG